MSTTVIILAAGMGKRLREHTRDLPKALVSVGGRPLISYAINHAKKLGADDIIVVGGYCYEALVLTVAHIDSEILTVHNQDYTLQNLVSLKKGLMISPEGHDLFVLNCDYIFRGHTLSAIKDNATDFSIFCSHDLSGDADDVMKVKTNTEGNLSVLSKTLTDFDAIFTGCWFVSSSLVPTLRDVMEDLAREKDLVTTTVEEIFREFVKRGLLVHVADVGLADWLEIDTPEELLIAERKLKEGWQ